MDNFKLSLDNFTNNILNKMGIKNYEKKEKVIEFNYSALSKIKIELQTRGRDIKLKDLKKEKDKTLEYMGNKVILYIRDQYIDVETGKPRKKYKFHISWCDKLEEMEESGREQRYVVSNRRDGKFVVNFFDGDSKRLLLKEEEVEIEVCVRCLSALKYKGFKFKHASFQQHVNNFKIEEFFKKYDTQIDTSNFKSSTTSPLNVYSYHWYKISKAYREKMRWKCEKCGKDCSENNSNLEVHHIDRNKANNNESNFKALCTVCHKKEHENEY